MSPRRRRVLHCLGAAGVGLVSGCLRLTEEEADADPSPTATRSDSETATPSTDFTVRVVGRQFSWSFAYPEFDLRERDELVLPVDSRVDLAVTSEDVLHGFSVDALDVAVDAIPDERTVATVAPVEIAEYTAVCTEFCGEGHADMTAPVRIVSESEFERWRS
jgi:heme/copper-type cytochrome/quinol oxidase subunit 2